jgi:anti-sigma B factor antagonist
MATSLEIALEDGPVRVVRLIGELDLDSAPRSRATLDTAVTSASQPMVVLDLSQLTFCDSSGVRVLLGLHRLAAGEQRELRIRDATSAVTQVLTLTGADRVLLTTSDDDPQ